MSEIISTTIELISPTLTPSLNFIEAELLKKQMNPIRWAIVKISENKLTLSVSYLKDN